MSTDDCAGEARNVGRIDHICFVYGTTGRQEEAKEEFSFILGVRDWVETSSESRKMRVLISWDAGIELIAPTGPGSFMDDHLERHGEGFYSFSVGVINLDDAITRLESHGRTASKTQGDPVLYQNFDVARQALVKGPVGGVKVIIAELRPKR